MLSDCSRIFTGTEPWGEIELDATDDAAIAVLFRRNNVCCCGDQ